MYLVRLSFILFLLTLGQSQTADTTYDYVICGAGTAGLLLAVVLSENPNNTVLVLEAGADGRADRQITVPENRGGIINTQYDWSYTTTNQSGLYQNRTQGVPRGKTPGGSSAMNWMIYNTDSRVQLDIWQDLIGLEGWNWETLSTAFRETEDFYAPPTDLASILTYNAANHGGHGPILGTMQRDVLSFFPDYLEPTLRSIGYSFPQDRNGGNAVGAGFLPLAIRPSNYTRSYSGSAYSAVEGRSNLHLRTNSQVARILWSNTLESANVTASGVEYIDTASGSNTRNNISASNVILSGGIVGSPQMLQFSGVGEPSVLNAAGVTPRINLTSVGTGLRDPLDGGLQIEFSINNFTNGTYNQNFIQLEPASSVLSAADYAAASHWLNSTTSIPGIPDIQVQIFKQLWFDEQPIIEYFWFGSVFIVYNLSPFSAGTVRINSSDPLTPPVIDPNYNSVQATINGTTVDFDFWLWAKAVQHYATQLSTTPPLSNIISNMTPNPNTSFETFSSTLFERVGTSQHLTGGCPMLPRADGGVIDSQLRVYGTTNVRVVDGSVFPYQPSAHPMGMTYALAVHAARILETEKNADLSLMDTLALPASNASSTATATFPARSGTVTDAPQPSEGGGGAGTATASSGAGSSGTAPAASASSTGAGMKAFHLQDGFLGYLTATVMTVAVMNDLV